jgi:uncharacterized protein YyaL (SSP411 family)
MEHKHTNRLIHENSPYLLQHAHNPVDWYAWGDEAFEKAQADDKPILLSIGYSACHWCHVMERESFENEAIARLMNELFVNIKVDREERPDLDEIYMSAVQMLTGRGGWPMTLFLTPDRKPFYGGTYFPPEDRGGMPGFPRVLTGVNQAYRERPMDVDKSVEQIITGLQRLSQSAETAQAFSKTIIADAAAKVAQSYDPDNGGLGQAPKFPNAGVYELFLRHHHHSKSERYEEMVTHTLTKMARGGSTTISAAAFTATPSTLNGWCRILKRCFMTTRSFCGSIVTPTKLPASLCSNPSSVKCFIAKGDFIRLRMPTAKAKKESSSCGVKRR